VDHSEHSVRERAYALWERDGCIPGRNEHYWNMAERELLAERAAAAQPATETPVVAPVEDKPTETTPAKARAARKPKAPAAETAGPARKAAAKAPPQTAAAVVAAKAGAPRRRQTATGIVPH
jgi:hypothetical protein